MIVRGIMYFFNLSPQCCCV